MCECHVVHEYLCAVCMLGAYGGQNRELDPPGLELQTIVSHDAGAEKKPGSLARVDSILGLF